MSFDEKELFWAAGFLEGEGSFSHQTGQNGMQMSATQTNTLEPLERLQKLFGGQIHVRKQNPNAFSRKDYWHWHLTGMAAFVAVMHLFPIMSERRKAQISKALSWLGGIEGAVVALRKVG